MISLKAIQYFTPNHGPFPDKSFRKRRLVLSLCMSNNSRNSDEKTPPKGDSRKQELLVRIAMLQTQKVRLNDYLDERSAYLTQFAEEANAEIDQIGENALQELDEAGARVCSLTCFLGLIGLVVIGIADATVSLTSESDWRKVVVLGVILVGLLSQLISLELKNRDF